MSRTASGKVALRRIPLRCRADRRDRDRQRGCHDGVQLSGAKGPCAPGACRRNVHPALRDGAWPPRHTDDVATVEVRGPEGVVERLRSGALGISADEDAVGSLGRGTGRSR